MSEQLVSEQRMSASMPKRYLNHKIVEHLACQYTLGTLTTQVHKRVAALACYNELLAQRIQYWQTRFVSLDKQTPELPPSELTWENIAQKLAIDEPLIESEQSKYLATERLSKAQTKRDSFVKQRLLHLVQWFGVPTVRYASAFSVTILAMLVLFMVQPLTSKTDSLSYVAVLTSEHNGQAHLVASTYGESKKLVVNVINTPEIDAEQSFELWVVSKTDAEARSLGVIPLGEKLIEQQLTTAQWRLIKDSASLMVTIEEQGGSAIGEPSDVIVSRGLCVRLQAWKSNV